MPVVEANPEIATQAQEAEYSANLVRPEAGSHAESSSDMTSEQAIRVCPYLGKLAAEDPELAEQKAQEYISDPEKMAQIHSDEDSFWDDLEAEFSADEEDIGDEEPELSEDLITEHEAEAEVVNAQLDRESVAAQEEIQSRQLAKSNFKARRKRTRTKENPDRNVGEVDIEGIVGRVIAANPQACEDYRNGDTEALGILVNEAMELSKASK